MANQVLYQMIKEDLVGAVELFSQSDEMSRRAMLPIFENYFLYSGDSLALCDLSRLAAVFDWEPEYYESYLMVCGRVKEMLNRR